MKTASHSWALQTVVRGLVCLLPLAAGCQGGSPAEQDTDTGVETTPVGVGMPVDHPAVESPVTSRDTTRMTVDMLAAAIPVVAGNDINGQPITWTATVRGQPIPAISDAAYAGTLGRPDYVNVTAENLDPSMLYLKFMDDMARQVCDKILDADYARTDPASRTLVRDLPLDSLSDTATVTSTLKYLKLRFHGEKVTDDATVADLQSLLTQTADACDGCSDQNRTRAGWNAVCVALFLSPEFHIY